MSGPARLASVLLVLAVPAHAARIDVYPGPGTPIGEAIAAASPGDRIVLHGGVYGEAVTVDRPLTVTAVRGESVVIAGVGGEAAVVDIVANKVAIMASPGASLTLSGGAVAAVRMQHATGLKLVRVTASGGGQGLLVHDGARVKITECAFSSENFGMHLESIALGARVAISGGFTFGSAAGALLDDIAPGAPRGRSGVSFRNLLVTAGNDGGVSMRLVAADGVRLTGNTIRGFVGGFSSIELDAASDNNLILRNEIGPGAFDAGSGNCWRGNTGPGVPTTCP